MLCAIDFHCKTSRLLWQNHIKLDVYFRWQRSIGVRSKSVSVGSGPFLPCNTIFFERESYHPTSLDQHLYLFRKLKIVLFYFDKYLNICRIDVKEIVRSYVTDQFRKMAEILNALFFFFRV